jgi:hypothetical protein
MVWHPTYGMIKGPNILSRIPRVSINPDIGYQINWGKNRNAILSSGKGGQRNIPSILLAILATADSRSPKKGLTKTRTFMAVSVRRKVTST